MLIKGRPVGIWILAVWTVAHAIPGVLIASEISGMKSLLVGLVVAMELAVAGGLTVRWRIAWYLLIAQVVLTFFVLAAGVWAMVFVAAAWGLHATDTPAVLLIAGYLLFVCSAFMYLFHPEVEEYFAELADDLTD